MSNNSIRQPRLKKVNHKRSTSRKKLGAIMFLIFTPFGLACLIFAFTYDRPGVSIVDRIMLAVLSVALIMLSALVALWGAYIEKD